MQGEWIDVISLTFGRDEFMFRLAKFSFCMFAITTLIGCSAALDGFPERSTDPAADLAELKVYLGANKVNEYVNTPRPEMRLTLRNEIVNARIHAIDAHFGKFEEALHQQGIGIGIGTDWVVLALTGTTATVSGETLKTTLGAVSTGILGAKSSFDKHTLLEKSIPAVMAQMVASRKVALLTLRTGLQQDDSAYSLFQALSDLENYYRAGTIPGSLAGIAKDANQKAAIAEDGLRKVVSAGFTDDESGAKLYRYLGWDSNKKQFINANNVKKLRGWLDKNDLMNVLIPTFLSGDIFNQARAKSVKDLGAK